MNKRLKYLRLALIGLAVIIFCIIAFLLVTPTGRYLARAGWEEGKILSRRQPIDAIVSNPATEPLIRSKLELVLAARTFASDSLGLSTGKSFTTYSTLDRDTLVLIVSGAYRDRLQSYTWWFPIVGRVPYKGFFDFGAARRAQQDLAQKGFDAHLGAASAFSTLGWFNDPLLPTTIKSDSLNLANTVIHELTHNTFYASGGAVFNESFANFVGSRGAEQFFRARRQAKAADEVLARWNDEKVIGHFWAMLYSVVDSTFKAHPGDAMASATERISLRDSLYGDAKERLIHDLGPTLRTISPQSIERLELDNGILMSRRVYRTDLDVFDAVLAKRHGDLRAAVRDIVTAARSNKADPYAAVRALSGM